MTVTPLYYHCHLCRNFKAIAQIDSTVRYGKAVTLHYCGPCLGRGEVTESQSKPGTSRYLTNCRITEMGHTLKSLVLAAVGPGVATKFEINQSIAQKFGGSLNSDRLGSVLKELVAEGQLEEAGRLAQSKTWRISIKAEGEL